MSDEVGEQGDETDGGAWGTRLRWRLAGVDDGARMVDFIAATSGPK